MLNQILLCNPFIFYCKNAGVGISDAKIGTVFDAFAQVQQGQVTGTGLGLFGLRTRVEGLHGTCGARHNESSSTGTGTVFWFAVPYTPDMSVSLRSMAPLVFEPVVVNSAQETSRARTEVSTTYTSPSFMDSSIPPVPTSAAEKDLAIRMEQNIQARKLTAVVVEDMLSVRRLMERLLLKMGFARVDCYENGSRGLDALKATQVDIVFSDVQMPIMTGPEVNTAFCR